MDSQITLKDSKAVTATRHSQTEKIDSEHGYESSSGAGSNPCAEPTVINEEYRTLGRWQTALIFVNNEVGIGILSLPAALQTLGLIPGVIMIIFLGVLCTYSAYILGQFYNKHPTVLNIVDCAKIVGGRVFGWIVGIAFILNLCLTCASATLTMSIALNSMSGHALCTVGFIAIPTVASWALCIPRKMKFVANLGIPGAISITSSVLIVMIAMGKSGPEDAPAHFTKEIIFFGQPTFQQAFSACLNIAFGYAGSQGFVTVMAEMRDPKKDFVPALVILQSFTIPIYILVSVVLYCMGAQYTRSPAIGAAPIIPVKVAYGTLMVTLLTTALIFGHTSIKYLFVETMKYVYKTPEEISSNSRKAWTLWIGIGTAFWALAFILANVIPVFSSILEVLSAVFVSWFTCGIGSILWLHMNWDRQFKGWKKTSLAVINWTILAITLTMNSVGLWTSITGLERVMQQSGLEGPFTCADNSVF